MTALSNETIQRTELNERGNVAHYLFRDLRPRNNHGTPRFAAFAVAAAWWHTHDMHAMLPPIPRKHLGKWIALDHGNTKIVAVGDSLREARRAARAKGEPRPWMLKVPSGLFVGAGR